MMKSTTILPLLGLASGLIMEGLPVVAAPAPPITFRAEPEENGRLVYLPLPPQTSDEPPTHLFGMSVEITNNDTSVHDLSLVRLEFSYADGSTGNAVAVFDESVSAGGKKRVYLEPEDAVQLKNPPPTQVQVELYFDGLLNDPVVRTYDLAPYRAPTSSGTYLFPGYLSGLPDDLLWTHKARHTGNSQFFGYDFGVVGWDRTQGAYSNYRPGTVRTRNEDDFGWGVPVYCMADGIVLWSRSDYENNPALNTLVVQRMADHTAGPIHSMGELKVTLVQSQLGFDPFSGRVATAVRNTSGNLEIEVWDLMDYGNQIIPRGSVSGEQAQLIDVVALSSERLVTATRSFLGFMRLTLWSISSDGMTVESLDSIEVEQVEGISLTGISDSLFATAASTASGKMHLSLWEIHGADPGISPQPVAEEFAENVFEPTLKRLSLSQTGDSGRLILGGRDDLDRVKVMVWDFSPSMGGGMSPYVLAPKGENTADVVSHVAMMIKSGNVLTALRTAAGNLKVMSWVVSADGMTITTNLQAVAGPIQDLAVASARGELNTFISSVITKEGTLSNYLWTSDGVLQPQGTALELWGESGEETAEAVSLEEYFPNGGLLVGAIRTDADQLRIITWRVARDGGNEFRILHGNCRMVYAHFMAGSLNAEILAPGSRVKVGQFLGLMGNSGKSTGPHLHVHAEIIDESFSLEEMFEEERMNTEPHVLSFRPIPFRCAQAMRLSAAEAGGASNPNNSFAPMNGHGVYFERYGIQPDWRMKSYVDLSSRCPIPAGFEQCAAEIFGPHLTVNQALEDLCWAHELFIRNGHYDEAVLFDRGMIVRSYDGSAIIGSP